MQQPFLSLSRRVRRTPFSDRVAAAGVKAFTVYNHMQLPTVFDSIEADYQHLKTHVQVWDVSCERQVEMSGPDAARLAQILTPRDLSAMETGRCYYAPMVDETGGMLNDPVLLKLGPERFWASIADGDLGLWARGLATGLGLDVEVFEPDVSPLGVQGPKADDLMARVFGEEVRDIRFFRFKPLAFGDQTFVVARSGWSRQGGFEIYLEGAEHGEALWDELFAAGSNLDVRAGCPNLIERIEGGLLSYGSDMTSDNTPFECGLGRFCNVENVTECIGREALLEEARNGPKRQIRGLRIDGDALPPCLETWPIRASGENAGQVTSVAFSPDFACNVAIGMIDRAHWEAGTEVNVETPDGTRTARVSELPFT